MSRIIRTRKTDRSGILTSAGNALSANPSRCGYTIQNLGTNPLFVKEGESASTSDFDYILAPGATNDDGQGAFYETPAGQTYTGIVSVAGTSPRLVASERMEQDNTN